MPNFDWTFCVTWINFLLIKNKFINFDWIVNNLIVCNLLINYLNWINGSNTETATHRADLLRIGVLKNFAMFRGKQLLGSVFNKVAGLQLSCEYCKTFKNSFFHKTAPVAAFDKFIIFPRKRHYRRRNRFIFLINTTE